MRYSAQKKMAKMGKYHEKMHKDRLATFKFLLNIL